MPANITSNPIRTAERLSAVEAYAKAYLLDRRSFICSSYKNCLNSCGDNLYFPGQMRYVGKHFDLMIDGVETRIVIMGQEYGSPQVGCSFDERRADLAASAATPFGGRNPHMGGTTSILRLLLGRDPGVDPEGEQLGVETGSHVFDGFALVNALLCSAIGEVSHDGAAKGQATPTMYENCGRHQRAILALLEPTHLIIQGFNVRQWIGKALGLSDDTGTIADVELFGRPVRLFTFAHPSAGGSYGWWGNSARSRYLLETVAPAIREGKETGEARGAEAEASVRSRGLRGFLGRGKDLIGDAAEGAAKGAGSALSKANSGRTAIVALAVSAATAAAPAILTSVSASGGTLQDVMRDKERQRWLAERIYDLGGTAVPALRAVPRLAAVGAMMACMGLIVEALGAASSDEAVLAESVAGR